MISLNFPTCLVQYAFPFNRPVRTIWVKLAHSCIAAQWHTWDFKMPPSGHATDVSYQWAEVPLLVLAREGTQLEIGCLIILPQTLSGADDVWVGVMQWKVPILIAINWGRGHITICALMLWLSQFRKQDRKQWVQFSREFKIPNKNRVREGRGENISEPIGKVFSTDKGQKWLRASEEIRVPCDACPALVANSGTGADHKEEERKTIGSFWCRREEG